MGDPDRFASARQWVAESKRVVILTGAGISTESGIPDLRGPQGLWTRDPDAEKLSDIRYYRADTRILQKAWLARMEQANANPQPNAGHIAIADFERRCRLHALITQNIDGLHQKAGSSPEKVIEVHGTVHRVSCLDCGWSGPMQEALDRVLAGEPDPSCRKCGGILKSATISFGQNLVPEVIDRAMRAALVTDCLISVGSSLQVYPIAGAVPAAKSASAKLIIVNAQPTSFDRIADAVLRERIGEVLPSLLGG